MATISRVPEVTPVLVLPELLPEDKIEIRDNYFRIKGLPALPRRLASPISTDDYRAHLPQQAPWFIADIFKAPGKISKPCFALLTPQRWSSAFNEHSRLGTLVSLHAFVRKGVPWHEHIEVHGDVRTLVYDKVNSCIRYPDGTIAPSQETISFQDAPPVDIAEAQLERFKSKRTRIVVGELQFKKAPPISELRFQKHIKDRGLKHKSKDYWAEEAWDEEVRDQQAAEQHEHEKLPIAMERSKGPSAAAEHANEELVAWAKDARNWYSRGTNASFEWALLRTIYGTSLLPPLPLFIDSDWPRPDSLVIVADCDYGKGDRYAVSKYVERHRDAWPFISFSSSDAQRVESVSGGLRLPELYISVVQSLPRQRDADLKKTKFFGPRTYLGVQRTEDDMDHIDRMTIVQGKVPIDLDCEAAMQKLRKHFDRLL